MESGGGIEENHRLAKDVMIYLLLPVFNEEPNIETLYSDISKIAARHQIKILFVDDGSKDGTVEGIKKYFTDLNVDVLSFSENRGPGAAFNEGFKKILTEITDNETKIVTMEADATSDVDVLDKMLSISDLNFDLVLASVYAQGGGFEKTSWFRMFLSTTANSMIKFVYGIRVNTYTSFYRVYKAGTLRKIQEVNGGEVTRETGFICKLDILRSAVKSKASVIEVPITLMTLRRKGKSKMKIRKTMMEYFRYFFRSR